MSNACRHPKRKLERIDTNPSVSDGKISLEEVFYCTKCKQHVIIVHKRVTI